jgi:hypothetical protein
MFDLAQKEKQLGVPKVGEIVHYQAYGTPNGEYKSVARAAVITEVHPCSTEDEFYPVGLAILNPTGMFFNPRIKYSSEGKPGCWSRPPQD